jgi:hypothetical protein
MWFLVKSALEALYPRTDALPGVADTDLDPLISKLRREAPLKLRAGVVLAAIFFTISPLLTIGVPLPSLWLPRSLRDKHAYRIATHRLYYVRQLVLLLKMIAGMSWGADPTVRRFMGLEPYPKDPGTWRKS